MEGPRHGTPDVVVWKNQMTTQPAGLGESNEAVGVEIPQDSLEDVLDPITDALSDTHLPEEIGFRDREAIRQRLRDVLSDLRELRTRRRH